MNKFWMVKGNGPTTMQHKSYYDASTEAGRLARLHPGQTFVILEATVSVSIKEVPLDFKVIK